MKTMPPEIKHFVTELRGQGLGSKSIMVQIATEYPDARVPKWQVDRIIYPHVAARIQAKADAARAIKASRALPPPAMCACGEPARRLGSGWGKTCSACLVSEVPEGSELLRGVPDMNRLIAWVERAKRLMSADPEPAFDITHALRRLDLIERTHAYRIRSTTQADQSASIQ